MARVGGLRLAWFAAPGGGGDDRVWLEHSYDSFLSEQQTARGRSKAQRRPHSPSAHAQQHEPEQRSTTQTGTRSITTTSISIHLPPSFPLSCSFIFIVLFPSLQRSSGRNSHRIFPLHAHCREDFPYLLHKKISALTQDVWEHGMLSAELGPHRQVIGSFAGYLAGDDVAGAEQGSHLWRSENVIEP